MHAQSTDQQHGGAYKLVKKFINERTCAFFMPPLRLMIESREKQKGSRLTRSELDEVVENAVCIVIERGDAQKMLAARGVADMDPEQVWQEYQDQRLS